jgi:hypoxanthine phosphoribosyltransferase
MFFTVELTRKLLIDCEIDTIQISSYRNDKQEGIVLIKDIASDIDGRDVIVVDDIYDTGNTLRYIEGLLMNHAPKSISFCCLCYRENNPYHVGDLRYKGLSLQDEYVFGFGLDLNSRLRHLNNIYKINKSHQ